MRLNELCKTGIFSCICLYSPSIQKVSKALATSRKTAPVSLFRQIRGYTSNEMGQLHGRAMSWFKPKLLTANQSADAYFM